MDPDAERPSSRHLSGPITRAELRGALRRDRISWKAGDIYLVGEDGPMEGRPAADGTTILWERGGRWFVDRSERGRVDEMYAWVFETEDEACRWVYDDAFLARYSSAAEVYLRYLDDIGDETTAAAIRAHQAAAGAIGSALHAHPRNRPTT